MFDSHALKRWSIRLLSKLGNVGKTIKVHRARAMDKMGVNLIAELVRLTEKMNIPPAKNQ
jgi:FixJ family two-component response regulator